MAQDAEVLAFVQAAAELLRQRLEVAEVTVDLEKRQILINEALEDCLGTLSKTGFWGEENRLLSSTLWNAVGDRLEKGWLQARARLKPRGYAGDHELLRRIVDRELCEHPLGRCFDRYFQAQAAPQAVRNRFELAAGWIVDAVHRTNAANCRIASVGSGPAIDISLACSQLLPEQRSRLHVTLLDVDGEALDSAAERLSRHLAADQMTLVQCNVFRLAQRPTLAEHLQGSEVILCTGLFDYLTHTAAAQMLSEFWNRLAPGGTAYVFNFAPHNPTRAYMEWLGNWYLLYRSEAELKEIAHAAGIPGDNRTFGAEPLGIDLYLALNKPDSAEGLIEPG